MPDFEPPVPVAGPDPERWPDVIASGSGRPVPWRALAAAVTAAVVLLGVTASAPPSGGDRTASPGSRGGGHAWSLPPAAPAPTRLHLSPDSVDLPGQPAFFDVGPSGYGVVVTVDCPRHARCGGGLATSYGLHRWSPRTLPPGAADQGTTIPVVLDRGVLLLRDLARPGVRWHSRDGGLHWRRVPAGPPAEVVDASGGRLALEPPVDARRQSCRERHLVVHLRESGRQARLRAPPSGLRVCDVTSFPDPDGRLWAAGLDRAAGGAAVAVSRDAGRHWRVEPLPGTERASSVLVTFSGPDVYAVVVGVVPRYFPSLTAVFRYRATGWERVWAATGSEPVGIQQLNVCPDGLLLAPLWRRDLGGSRPLLFSPDAGRTWHQAAGLAPIVATAVPGDGWYGWYLTRPRQPLYSRDCRHWYRIAVE